MALNLTDHFGLLLGKIHVIINSTSIPRYYSTVFHEDFSRIRPNFSLVR
jgi:hypothetical protein